MWVEAAGRAGWSQGVAVLLPQSEAAGEAGLPASGLSQARGCAGLAALAVEEQEAGWVEVQGQERSAAES